ncbi:hypothetical protein [Arthrobacter gengyunqii]|uniref:Uncharacterized protein n=1 Tax=Arthrobacter gengyunqii TaxID=2886940 RepID=A0ABS8GKX7_9MICC|nr:hypothetical protein [Arthrobacter gengyunqii]MCC3265893.1 hypothetical protein [Arthrobacter gengyunqii]
MTIMKTVQEIFGTDSRNTYVNLNWAGRRETPSAIAERLSATMSLLAHRTGMNWYRDTADRNSQDVNFVVVPSDKKALIDVLHPRAREEAVPDFLNPHTDVEWSEFPTWMGFHIILRAGAERDAHTLATLNGSTASSMDRRNDIQLELEDDFPMGTPSDAARWFAELIRIWQPDHARFSNTATQLVTGLTHAAYLSWTSTKAYVEPESAQEIRIPFGDGNLHAARLWTPSGIAALNRELAQAGAPRYSKRPKQQDLPSFPDKDPEGLETLDDEVDWGQQDSTVD